jgi:hypothetical protein
MTATFNPQPKPRPRALDKQDRVKRKQSVEDRENAIVKARSYGQCEVREMSLVRDSFVRETTGRSFLTLGRRCARRASQIHHFLGGSGRRGIGESAKAENKLHVCDKCHDEITRHILQPHWTQVENRAGTSYFIRVK